MGIVLLFAPNTFSSDVYYFDNLDSISGVTTAMPSMIPTKSPTHNPTNPLSSAPTNTPTNTPTLRPSSNPTISPSVFPTESPSIDPDTMRLVGNFDSTDEATYVYSSGTY